LGYLLGTYPCQIDPKGRLSLPAKLRKTLNSENHSVLYLVGGGFAGSLFLFTPEGFESLCQRLNGQRDTTAKADSRNLLYARSSEVRLDRQGRIAIPPSLLNTVSRGPERRVIVVGVGDKIGIWEPSAYELYHSDAEAHYRETLKVHL
jgi:MraZ protein